MIEELAMMLRQMGHTTKIERGRLFVDDHVVTANSVGYIEVNGNVIGHVHQGSIPMLVKISKAVSE